MTNIGIITARARNSGWMVCSKLCTIIVSWWCLNMFKLRHSLTAVNHGETLHLLAADCSVEVLTLTLYDCSLHRPSPNWTPSTALPAPEAAFQTSSVRSFSDVNATNSILKSDRILPAVRCKNEQLNFYLLPGETLNYGL